jgi:hypothetical protein
MTVSFGVIQRFNRPWAGLSRDDYIQHLILLESATFLNKLLLTRNGWKFLWVAFCVLLIPRYDWHIIIKLAASQSESLSAVNKI